jgi:hypothetical protein
MDALLANHTTTHPPRSESSGLARCAAFGLVGLIWFVAAVLCISRISGGIHTAPDQTVMWLIAVLLVLLSAGARQLWRLERRADIHSAAQVTIDWASLPAMVIAGWAIALPSQSSAGIAGFLAIVLVAEIWALRSYSPAFRKTASNTPSQENTPAQQSDLPRISSEAAPSLEPGDQIRIDPPQTPMPHFPTEDIAQQLVRRVDDDGNDVLQGWVRAVFEPQQRTASAHVAFCPTLEGELSIVFEQVDGNESRVKAAQLLPYGVRFDVKLADAAEIAESVLIEFVAKGDAVLARATS